MSQLKNRIVIPPKFLGLSGKANPQEEDEKSQIMDSGRK